MLDRFLKKSLRGVFTPYLGYVHTKFSINKISCLSVSFYTDSQTNSLFYYYQRFHDNFKSALEYLKMNNHCFYDIMTDKNNLQGLTKKMILFSYDNIQSKTLKYLHFVDTSSISRFNAQLLLIKYVKSSFSLRSLIKIFRDIWHKTLCKKE